MYASAIGTECMEIYTGYHIPPNITQCVTQAKCEITKNKNKNKVSLL